MGKVLESHKGELNPQRLVKVELLPPSAGGTRRGNLEGESFREGALRGDGAFSLGLGSQFQAIPRGGSQRVTALTSPPSVPP